MVRCPGLSLEFRHSDSPLHVVDANDSMMKRMLGHESAISFFTTAHTSRLPQPHRRSCIRRVTPCQNHHRRRCHTAVR